MPILRDEIVAEAVLPLLLNQAESRSFVDPARPGQDVVRPEHRAERCGDALSASSPHRPGRERSGSAAKKRTSRSRQRLLQSGNRGRM